MKANLNEPNTPWFRVLNFAMLFSALLFGALFLGSNSKAYTTGIVGLEAPLQLSSVNDNIKLPILICSEDTVIEEIELG